MMKGARVQEGWSCCSATCTIFHHICPCVYGRWGSYIPFSYLVEDSIHNVFLQNHSLQVSALLLCITQFPYLNS